MTEAKEDLAFLVNLHTDQLLQAQDKSAGVFIAFVPMDGGVSVEVEADLDSVVFTMFAKNYDDAKDTEEHIKTALKAIKVHVYDKYEDYERACMGADFEE